MVKVDTVLLDVDGTLIDSTYYHALAWMRAFARYDLTPSWWRVHRTIGMGGDLLVGEICGKRVEEESGDDLRDEWAKRYRELLPEITAFAGADRLVRSLRDDGSRVALASSGAAEFTDAALKILGMKESDFAAVTSADDAGQSKPEPDILAEALRRAGGHHAVLIGDTIWDVEAARRLPADCVTVRSGGFGEAELRDAGASLVVDDVTELVETGWSPSS